MIKILMAVTFMLITPLANAASFDCSKASNFIEKSICTDPLLSKLDDALSENYKQMSAANIGDSTQEDLKASQRAWLKMRNKCTDTKCLIDTYKKRIDLICEDYSTVLSGVAPVCISSDEVEAELKSPSAEQTAAPQKTVVTKQAPVVLPEVRNAQKIKQLHLPESFINSVLYVNYMGQWSALMPCNRWLGLLFDNKKLESIKGISANGKPGVMFKRAGQPAFGLLFRIEGKEAYLSSLVAGDKIEEIQDPATHSQMANFMQAITDENAM